MARILHLQSAVFLILLGPPLAVALAEGAAGLAFALGLPALAVAAASATRRRASVPDDLRRAEAVLSVVAVFLLAIAMTMPAYLALGLSPVDAAFEATSAITTTGFSMATDPGAWPVAAHVLRAWSQWCGGLVIAIAGLAFLIDRGPLSRALGLADFGDEGLKSSTRRHARALLVAYLAITAVGVAGAALLIPARAEGALVALAAVSTGGMAPRADSLASYTQAAQVFVVALSLAGALSLALPVLAWRAGPRAGLRESRAAHLLASVGLACLACAALSLIASGADAARLLSDLLHLLSFHATAGFTVGPVAGPAPLLVLFIAVMAIGGQTGSSAGGLKIDRLRLIAATVGLVLRRALSPAHGLVPFRHDGEMVEDARLHFAVALAAVYGATALLLWIVFALSGAPPLPALFDIVSALSTVGAGTGVIGPDLPAGLKLGIVLAMLLGRLEFFGLMLLAMPVVWGRR